MESIKRLPDAELEVMKALWRLGRPATRAEIEAQLKHNQKWATQTVLSLLSRLEAKGFVSVARQGKAHLYAAAVAKDAYLKTESKTILDKLFDGSPKSFMAALVQNNKLTDKDLKELEDYLQEVRKGGD